MTYLKEKIHTINGKPLTLDTEILDTETLKINLKNIPYTKHETYWEFNSPNGYQLRITPQPNHNKPCPWTQPTGTSRTHYTNTRWWMGDFHK